MCRFDPDHRYSLKIPTSKRLKYWPEKSSQNIQPSVTNLPINGKTLRKDQTAAGSFEGGAVKVSHYKVTTMKVRITAPDNFTLEQESLLEMHSFLNLVNVLIGNINLIAMIVNREDCFPKSSGILHHIMEHLRSSSDTLNYLGSLPSGESIQKIICQEFAEVRQMHPEVKGNIWKQSEVIFDGIFEILAVRITEIKARQKPILWKRWEIQEVEKSLREVFYVIALNSRGKFCISFDPATKKKDDYLLSIKIESITPGYILMPEMLSDSIRDLAANARKYSKPGTDIKVSMQQTAETLTLEISDQGRGIPEKEINQVVFFGVRGSNTLPAETKGGGFGLTKAWCLTHHHGGTMWIDSTLNVGTTVTIQIPVCHQG